MPPSNFYGTPEGWTRKDGPTEGRVKKCPVDTFLVRGRVHSSVDASGTDVDTDEEHSSAKKERAAITERGRQRLPLIFMVHRKDGLERTTSVCPLVAVLMSPSRTKNANEPLSVHAGQRRQLYMSGYFPSLWMHCWGVDVGINQRPIQNTVPPAALILGKCCGDC